MRSTRPAKPPPVVLVVDDSAVARLAVARRLRAEGFEVLELASAAPPEPEALARVACALLDLDLGDADGSDLARSLLALRPDLPVAFFSGSASRELLTRARALGPVFAKPGELDAAVIWIRGSTQSA
jgi:CheY-like chemotaxis protein